MAVAIQLLGLSLPLAIVIWFARRRDQPVAVPSGFHWWLLQGVLGFLVVLAPPFMAFACTCGTGNNPLRQTLIPALGAFVLGLLAVPLRARLIANGLLLLTAIGLSWHFQALVLPANPSSCRYTGEPAFVTLSCDRPVTVLNAWHTPVTGLHPLR